MVQTRSNLIRGLSLSLHIFTKFNAGIFVYCIIIEFYVIFIDKILIIFSAWVFVIIVGRIMTLGFTIFIHIICMVMIMVVMMFMVMMEAIGTVMEAIGTVMEAIVIVMEAIVIVMEAVVMSVLKMEAFAVSMVMAMLPMVILCSYNATVLVVGACGIGACGIGACGIGAIRIGACGIGTVARMVTSWMVVMMMMMIMIMNVFVVAFRILQKIQSASVNGSKSLFDQGQKRSLFGSMVVIRLRGTKTLGTTMLVSRRFLHSDCGNHS